MSIAERIKNGEFRNPNPRPKDIKDLKAWQIENSRLTHQVFKQALAEECGVVGHPKLDRLFELAWDYGHHAGLQEVVNYFEELSDLLT